MGIMNPLVIAIRSLNRAEYLRQCLASLEANIDLEGVDFLFYQDGAVNQFSGIRYATDEEVGASLQAFRDSKLPNKTIWIKEHNVGSAIQKIEMLLQLFGQYSYVMMLDNDLVFSKYYIKTIKTLFRQFERHPDIGMLQTSYFYRSTIPIETFDKAEGLQDKVDFGYGMRWEQGFWKAKWNRIFEHFEPYIAMTQDIDYKELLDKRSLLRTQEVRKYYGEASADYVLEKCVGRAGLKGIHTLALRHKTIGEIGNYSGKRKFIEEGFGRIQIFDVGDVNKYVLISEPNWDKPKPKPKPVEQPQTKPGFIRLRYLGNDAPCTISGPKTLLRYRLRKGAIIEALEEDVVGLLKVLEYRRFGPPIFERVI